MTGGSVQAGHGSTLPVMASSAMPARQSRVFFQYVGRTRLTVIGPVTGRAYRFDRPGASLDVDFRDRRSLAVVPNLRQVTPVAR
jgi:hypothetical protein